MLKECVKNCVMKRFPYIIWIVLLCLGCGAITEDQADRLKKADYYATQGRRYTQDAIGIYKALITQTSNPSLKEEIKLKLGNMYLEAGSYDEAIKCFQNVLIQEAKKKLAVAYFKNAQQSDALAQFERLGQLSDDEYMYYYGLTLERNNLYDKAIEVYSLIAQNAHYYSKAQDRLKAINLSEDKLLLPQVKEIIENAPDYSQYPEAGAIILLADESFETFDDNTAVYDMHFLIKIFNDRGKEEFSEIQIGYDSTFEEVKLDYARTIKPDGTMVYVGEKNIRDVSIYLNFPLYSNARARIISMPEVCDGAIIEYRAKIFHKQLVNKKDFVLNYVSQEGEPIKAAKFSVKVPQERSFKYKIINSKYNTFSANLEPTVSTVENKKVFEWNIENVPEIIPESDMSPVSRVTPIIMMSTFEKWDDIYSWWYKLYKDKIEIDDNIKKKITELTKDKPTPLEKLRAIYNFCTQDIRYVAVEYGQAGYEPHQARDIFQNKYGDCKDKAILLIAMLRSIGINAHPVLIGTYDNLNLNEDLPSIAFNHCIAVVDFEGGYIFMDPTGQTVPFGDLPSMDQDRLVFAILDDGYKIIPTPLFESGNNFSHMNMNVDIKEDESINATRQIETKGVFEHGQRYWLKFTKPKIIKETLEATANRIAPGSRLVNYKIENETDLDKDIVLEYEFNAPEYCTKADKKRLLPQLGGINISSVVKEKRSYPIEYPNLFETAATMVISLPKNLVLQYLPENIKINSDWFEFENIYSKDGTSIIFYEKFKLKKKIVLQDEYEQYKGLVEDIARKINQNIILEEKPNAKKKR
jgi:tetratricopeptide (TPR) repeat protein